MNMLRIGIFGAALDSANFGCTALGITQIKYLQMISEEYHVDMEYWIFSDDSTDAVSRVKQLLKVERLQSKYVIRIKTGLRGYRRLKKDICACDFIIDLTYGDSFSDIYGRKYFYLYSIPKLIAIKEHKCLILGPQTVGPFYHTDVHFWAKYILRHADYLLVRDEMSFACAEKMTGRKDIALTSDLVMDLPYQNQKNPNYVEGKLNIGLNVSLLLWQNTGSNARLEMNLDYRKLMTGLLDILTAKEQFAVHLITHVYDKSEYTEYMLAQELQSKYKNVILAPQFANPVEAKNYMAKLDVVIGSRMHATIEAFSAKTPVIPVSYSRKFEGLYKTLGYNHCVDCTKETNESALQKILLKVEQIDALEADRGKALDCALRKNQLYYNLLTELITKKIGDKR